MFDKSNWTTKEYIGLTIIPCEFTIGALIHKLPSLLNNDILASCVNSGIFIIGFLIMIFLFKDFLKDEWKNYKEHKLWRKLLLNILFAAGIFAILALSRYIGNLSINDSDSLNNTTISFMLISSIPPLLAPFAEELTFRYLLFGKFSNKFFKLLMLFVSSILFGMVHINNFSGQWLQTIPYMIVGLYLALIYYNSKNIWASIIVHWIFNTFNSILPALFIVIMKLIGAV